MITLKPQMQWPPMDVMRHKIREHSAWYSGEAEILADFYNGNSINSYMPLTYATKNKNNFWGRQIKNNSDFFMHVPVANDIAETSAAFLFSESPLVRFPSDKGTAMETQQEALDTMLTESGFFMRILEAAETCSSIGGVFMKTAWDAEISDEPIPVVVQPDWAFPVFRFGKLKEVTFVYEVENDGSTVYRLAEKIEKGKITNTLYKGSSDNLGNEVELGECEATADMEVEVATPDIMTAVYIPNMLPNKLNRNSPQGRSDYQGIETLMDALDETFSGWMVDVQLARAKVHLPEGYLDEDGNGNRRFNFDTRLYVEMHVDPTSMSKELTATQFAIRAEEYEKTCLNLLDRIITSAGYSPQSFGLNIAGRAESGTALNVRERKSFATTNKKQAYWEPALKHLVKAMCMVKNQFLGGKFTSSMDVNVSFSDSVNNNLSEISNAVKTLADAKAISTDTKVRMVHPEWTDKQVTEEVERILNDSTTGMPPENPEDEMQKAFGLTNRNNQDDFDEPTEDKQ